MKLRGLRDENNEFLPLRSYEECAAIRLARETGKMMRGHSSMVEPLPSKQKTTGSIPAGRSSYSRTHGMLVGGKSRSNHAGRSVVVIGPMSSRAELGHGAGRPAAGWPAPLFGEED